MDVMSWWRALVGGDEGQDLLEYALLVAVVAVTNAGTAVNTIFTNIANALATAA